MAYPPQKKPLGNNSKRILIEPGDIYGDLKFIRETFGDRDNRNHRIRNAIFYCVCGKEIKREIKAVVKGNTKSCGCRRSRLGAHNAKDLLGKRFGRRIVIKKVGIDKNNRILWECRCDCGSINTVSTNQLARGKALSCGCLKKEVAGRQNRTHGFSYTLDPKKKNFYKKWKNLQSRCTNKKRKDYHHYGGRGIKNLWSSFNEFEKDMWESFDEYTKDRPLKDATIDRIDVNGHYCKGNCRWASQSMQMRNTRKSNNKKKRYDR